MKFKLLIILLVSFATASFGQNADENAVWNRVEALNQAVFGSKDSVAIRDLVSSKLTYGHSSGNIEDMATMVHNASVSSTVYKNPTTEKISISFVNKTAIVRYIFRAISVEKGVEAPLNIGLLQVWAKEQKKWKLVARQAVRVTPK